MPKTERILANLPPTFRTLGDPSALRALADAYGGELQAAENSLVAVMRAHWVDFADAGEQAVKDLALIGALYGLAPRADETVEEFRDHLKRHVRTYLDGTVTVRGLLRITAEALGLHIEDDALDTWWTRSDPVLLTTLPRGADAASLVLGVPSAERLGANAQPAVLTGDVDLRAGVDLRERNLLWIARDGHGAIPVDLTTGAANPAKVLPFELVDAINTELGLAAIGVRGRPRESTVATEIDGKLQLTSTTTGPSAQIAVEDGPEDAAELVLGLRSRSYQGSDPTHARVTGTADLSTPVDLTSVRYLRIGIDGNRLAEIDCAALADSADAVDISDITEAINEALGLAVAGDDGRFLTLTSPTPGAAGFVAFFQPAAQDATRRLFGDVPPFTIGQDARRASVTGDRQLGFGVDLRTTSKLRLALDGQPGTTLDIAGTNPEATTPVEVVTAINEGLLADVASHNGELLTLRSTTAGPAGTLVVEPVDGDASEAVLGLRPRSVGGRPPRTASLTGTVDLSAGVNLSARHVLALSVDGAPPIEIDLRQGVADPAAATLDELTDAINAAVGGDPSDPVASNDGAHLILVSSTEGAAGSLAVHPLVGTRRRRFVTRARVTDDAATTVFGFTARRTTGTPAATAVIAGRNDLSAGADLTVDRYLRLTIGDHEPLAIDCAGPRPRATTPAEIAQRINDAAGMPVAFTDGKTIRLVSPGAGADTRLVVEPPHSRDALDRLGLARAVAGGEVRGLPPAGVRLTGIPDLSAGVELPADAALRIGVDGAAPIDVPVGDGTQTAVRSLSQLVAAINLALLAQVAAHDGTHLLLTSPTTGSSSVLELAVPVAGTDATADLLGIAVPRTYHGAAATAASVLGGADLTAPQDLTIANLLRLTVDGGEPVVVDLTSGIPPASRNAVTVSQIATAINAQTTAVAAAESVPGGIALRISSPSTGVSSRLEISRSGAGNAAPLLFGSPAITAAGLAPGPAVLDGDAELFTPVDLSKRSVLRLAIDGATPVDIDVAGVTSRVTLLGEIVNAINDVLPGLAQATETSRLRLTSPTEGPDSSVEVVPLRFLDLEEYPPGPDSADAPVAHGTVLRFRNTGASAVPGRVELTTTTGVNAPRLADPVAGWSVRVHEPIGPGARLILRSEPDGGFTATIVIRGQARTVPPELVEVTGTGALTVRRGQNRWSYSECRAARFDAAYFDADRFAGGPCSEQAVFDLSRFDNGSVFAKAGSRTPTAHVRIDWDSHQPGRLRVNLPAELDRRFGVAFGEGRFGTRTPLRFEGVVTEPNEDDNHIIKRVNEAETVVEAKPAPFVPIGWSPVTMPFRDPVPLTLGDPDTPAALYLSEPGLGTGFVKLEAAEPGAFGNEITVTCRTSGPAIYDLEVSFPGGRFEVARSVAFGPPLPTLADALLQPGPAGVGTAKAAGIHADITRDRVHPAEEGTP